jgi:hypothetical protein
MAKDSSCFIHTKQVTNSNMGSRIFLILTILLGRSQAATNVGGILLRDTVWPSVGSANPYTFTGDVQIPFNVTLTIKAGVQVIFDNGDFEFFVKGALKIEGTAAKPVQFSGGKSSDTKWMITFQSTDLNRSSISHTVFTGPKRALQLNNAATGLQQNTGVLVLQAIKCFSGTEIAANGKLFMVELVLESLLFVTSRLE